MCKEKCRTRRLFVGCCGSGEHTHFLINRSWIRIRASLTFTSYCISLQQAEITSSSLTAVVHSAIATLRGRRIEYQRTSSSAAGLTQWSKLIDWLMFYGTSTQDRSNCANEKLCLYSLPIRYINYKITFSGFIVMSPKLRVPVVH